MKAWFAIAIGIFLLLGSQSAGSQSDKTASKLSPELEALRKLKTSIHSYYCETEILESKPVAGWLNPRKFEWAFSRDRYYLTENISKSGPPIFAQEVIVDGHHYVNTKYFLPQPNTPSLKVGLSGSTYDKVVAIPGQDNPLRILLYGVSPIYNLRQIAVSNAPKEVSGAAKTIRLRVDSKRVVELTGTFDGRCFPSHYVVRDVSEPNSIRWEYTATKMESIDGYWVPTEAIVQFRSVNEQILTRTYKYKHTLVNAELPEAWFQKPEMPPPNPESFRMPPPPPNFPPKRGKSKGAHTPH